MHEKTAQLLKHSHNFVNSSKSNENKTLYVIILTAITMCAEISTGLLTGSMALLADGWHMGTHAFALGITFFAYVMSRHYQFSKKYTFGTGKFGILAGYTSAIFLAGTAIYMIVESGLRFIYPVQIAFNEAIIVTVIGLFVNLISVWILQGKKGDELHHSHHHDHTHDHNRHDHKHDHNLQAAYLHVLADALTSVLAIIALLSGKYFGLTFLDPVMGIIGGILILKWSWGLITSSSSILLDGNVGDEVYKKIIQIIQSDNDSQVIDLHVWQLNSNELAAIVSVVARQKRTPLEYSFRLKNIKKLKHITIETHTCTNKLCECMQHS